MPRLLALGSRRYLARHPWQLATSVVGIALGCAVVVGVDLAAGSAERAFRLAHQAVTGRATHAVVGVTGRVPDRVYRRLRLAGVRAVAPVVEAVVPVAGEPGRTVTLLGVDPFAEALFRPYYPAARHLPDTMEGFLLPPAGGLLEAAAAAELGLAPGDRVGLRVAGEERQVRILGLLQEEAGEIQGANLLVVDVATAQEVLGVEGLNRIDVAAPEGPEGEAVLAAVTGKLPEGLRLERSRRRTETSQELTRAFRLNLTALSLLSLLCGAFLIYNSMSFAVVQRRRLLGVLRALGVTRREVFTSLLGEALLVGAAGTLLGLGLGALLARGLVARTINDLYYAVEVRSVALDGWILAKGVALGLGATLAASLVPAREATGAPPRVVLARAELERKSRRSLPGLVLAGLALAGLGTGLLHLPGGSIGSSFAGLFAVLLGCTLFTPLATVLVARLLRRPAGLLGGLLGRMAAGDVAAHLSRTGVAVAALMMAVAVSLGVGLMIDSFRSTVSRWLTATLPADHYLSGYSPPGSVGVPAPGVPRELLERIRGLPGVERVNTLQSAQLDTPQGPVEIVALELDHRSYGAFRLEAGDAGEAWPAFHRGEAVLVSEPFAYRRGISVGDRLELPAPGGDASFRVAGIYFDYSSDRGVVLMDRRTYARRWREPGIDAASVFAAPGAADRLEREIRRLLPPEGRLTLRSSGAIRSQSLAVFDRTFSITRVLRLLTGLVAAVGVLSALLSLALERSREMGVLRATGLTPAQLWGLATAQTGILGLVAGLLSLPVGVLTASLMIRFVNRRSFGWTMPLEVDPWILLQGLLLSVGAALAAGLYPAWRMARTPPAEALREE